MKIKNNGVGQSSDHYHWALSQLTPQELGPADKRERQLTPLPGLGSELVNFLVSMGPKFGWTIQLRMGSF